MCGKPKVHKPASPEEQDRKAAEQATIAANKDLAARRVHRDRDTLGASTGTALSMYGQDKKPVSKGNGVNSALTSALQSSLGTALNMPLSKLGKQ